MYSLWVSAYLAFPTAVNICSSHFSFYSQSHICLLHKNCGSCQITSFLISEVHCLKDICMQNAHQYRVAGSDPLLNSTSWIRLDVSHTRIKVPLQEAVATMVPCWFTARHASSPRWALIVTGALDMPASVFAKSYVK